MNNIDNPFTRILSDIGDLIILNFLLIICCIPVITAGASIASTHKVTMMLADRSCSSVIRSFFQAFKENFKVSSLLWLCSIVIISLLVIQYTFIISLDVGLFRNIWSILLLVVLFVFTALLTYIFPLIIRYDNSIVQHIKNSTLLSIAHFPRTLLMVVLNLLPFFLLFSKPALFFYSLPFWILIGFAVIVLLNTELLKPILLELDQISSGAHKA